MFCEEDILPAGFLKPNFMQIVDFISKVFNL